MGVKGFKIDHFDRDDAAIARFLRETAALAAKHRLVLDYHGIHKPTGLSRTFPNVLTYEGILGLETAKWAGNDLDFITNDLRIPFTRLLAGPADYTPGAMRNATRQTFRPNVSRPMSMGTRCRQAALLMLLDTNFRVFCDSPSAYAREPAYTRFLATSPSRGTTPATTPPPPPTPSSSSAAAKATRTGLPPSSAPKPGISPFPSPTSSLASPTPPPSSATAPSQTPSPPTTSSRPAPSPPKTPSPSPAPPAEASSFASRHPPPPDTKTGRQGPRLLPPSSPRRGALFAVHYPLSTHLLYWGRKERESWLW